MIGSRTLKRVRNYLVKKAEVERHYLTDEHLVFEINLTNFLFFKEIHVEFWNNEEIVPVDCELTDKDNLKFFIPLSLLATIETGAKVKVFINHKAAWLTEHPSYKEGD
ncbi:MAG TPA: hypothetical protein VK947_13540, partial [Planococcus sp. (in: firmicutes)]|nr:hypothetical protein [Planococcus sp. (in: firmicutes)]